jgi:2-aminoethylphosphonate-pyruvate transaminase
MKKDNILFTPGPLNTSITVKEAMLRDLGSRDFEFMRTVQQIRGNLLNLAGVSKETGFEAVIMQGSGTFGIESVITSCVPDEGHILILNNGAYGERMKTICRIHHIRFSYLDYAENMVPDISELEKTLISDKTVTHVAMVHCETTTGIVNPLIEAGRVCSNYSKVFIVDAMSSFGAIPINPASMGIDFLISSSNKCIEGVPGFSFIIARKKCLDMCREIHRTLALDLYQQWEALESTGQFRFTPPTHVLLAFYKALEELETEGGVYGRSKRYHENYTALVKGMNELGFRPYLPEELRSYIITAFYYPDDLRFDFSTFYAALNAKGFSIYPGKLSHVNCFRIGNIGRIDKIMVQHLIMAIEEVLAAMDIRLSQRVGTGTS